MPSRLVPLNPGPAPVIPIQRPVLLIGRHPDCDVRIDAPKVSRRHCCLALAYDRVMVRDLGSLNGLRVNGKLVDEVRLVPGDEVAIGPLLFRFEEQDITPPPGSNPSPARSRRPPPPPPPAPRTSRPCPVLTRRKTSSPSTFESADALNGSGFAFNQRQTRQSRGRSRPGAGAVSGSYEGDDRCVRVFG